jgi:hypothetical protein
MEVVLVLLWQDREVTLEVTLEQSKRGHQCQMLVCVFCKTSLYRKDNLLISCEYRSREKTEKLPLAILSTHH